MRERGVRRLLVCDADRKLVGIISPERPGPPARHRRASVISSVKRRVVDVS